jgi:hypothetical protein
MKSDPERVLSIAINFAKNEATKSAEGKRFLEEIKETLNTEKPFEFKTN